ncbi:MAG: hypothetical protein HRU25_02415 [Psychrobium sp.]|nr:hypothetical protein [Psychrobium sp.]
MRGSALFNQITDNGTVADLNLVHEQANQYSAGDDSHKSKIVQSAMLSDKLSGEINAIIPNVSSESLSDLLSTIEFNNRTIQ